MMRTAATASRIRPLLAGYRTWIPFGPAASSHADALAAAVRRGATAKPDKSRIGYPETVRQPQRPAPPPLEGNDRLITAGITAGWVVALIVLLVIRDQLAAADRWWVWVPAFGTAFGLFGLVWVPYLKRSRNRASARRLAAAQQAQQGQGQGQRGPGEANGTPP
jgi:hypothetical protein